MRRMILVLLYFLRTGSAGGGGGGEGAARLSLFLFFPVQQTTSGISHRVKYFFRVGNQYAECEKQLIVRCSCTPDTVHFYSVYNTVIELKLSLNSWSTPAAG